MPRLFVLIIAATLLASCAAHGNIGDYIPHWAGGFPEGTPPRPPPAGGTPCPAGTTAAPCPAAPACPPRPPRPPTPPCAAGPMKIISTGSSP